MPVARPTTDTFSPTARRQAGWSLGTAASGGLASVSSYGNSGQGAQVYEYTGGNAANNTWNGGAL